MPLSIAAFYPAQPKSTTSQQLQDARCGLSQTATSLALLVFLSTLVNTAAYAQWVEYTSGVSATFRDVHFVSETTGWAVGDGATILKTTDGGASWSTQSPGVSEQFSDVQFIDPSTGWVAGTTGSILKTTDGGASWSAVSVTEDDLRGIHFIDDTAGWVVSSSGTIWMTSDGGSSFSPQSTPISSPLRDIHFLDENIGLAVGGKTILRTEDGGETWSQVQFFSSTLVDDLWDVEFVNDSTAWAVGRSAMFKSSDAGATWQLEVFGSFPFYDIHFADESHGWAVTLLGGILHTTNGGEDWETTSLESRTSFFGVHFIDASTGWVVGTDGNVAAFRAPATSIGDPADELPMTVELDANYPNPFNPTTSIRFSLPERSPVRLSIYDQLGREISVLLQGQLGPGEHTAFLDASGLSSGVYLYRLEAGGEVLVRSMTLAK